VSVHPDVDGVKDYSSNENEEEDGTQDSEEDSGCRYSKTLHIIRR
jgi:hypothetical protein